MAPTRFRVPDPMTLRKSRELRRVSGRETFPAFVPTRLERGATGPGPHPMSESMTPLATSHLGLISPFHVTGKEESVGGRTQVKDDPIPSQSSSSPPSGPYRPIREEILGVAKRTIPGNGPVSPRQRPTTYWKRAS
jgi:hypothetical protein